MHKGIVLGLLALVSLLPTLAVAQEAPTLVVEPGTSASATSAGSPQRTADSASASPADRGQPPAEHRSFSADTAQGAPPSPLPGAELRNRFELGARFGYGRALGGDASNLFQIGAHLPIVIEAGWRSSPRVSLLFGFQYAPLFRSGCIDGKSCSGRELKGTVTVVYHFKPGASFDPWFGYSMGYESIQLNGPIQYDVRNALEVVNLQLGGDWQLSSATSESPIRLGPFLSISADMPVGAQFRRQTAHSWFVLGVRGTVDL